MVDDFYEDLSEGNHYYSMFSVQMVKIAEETNLIDVNEMHDVEDMIAEHLDEDKL
ncbi:hypothetical protein JSY36_09220 [Bacillus sp. H-16]|uniref:hypothetical protein n=1 Tax=Alteribacter salitolerans TaxID=2912333 RepID=UPI001965FD54|nr:hypothetical protein [Alteribacter salitolerans]MBM7095934.1 hypothetical protein [Alteribacter salitolerans]